MQSTTIPVLPTERSELASMLATLCSYETWFGPYHPQTLRLMAQVAITHWRAWEPRDARLLLERVIRDLGRHLGGDHDLRLRAIAILRDLFVAQRDYEKAASVQQELLECQIQRLGSDHPETLATRAGLAMILLEKIPCDSKREVS
jgi:hypothetical protein